ncbi:cupredoxin domain-containing protein [Candidatus Nomurabacteria bacterium]|nr:cupredoxin domain-containing protein [Candidatus Kaiserbacteria bacterium]MCB9814035.1 cupredoxin domain-containing protein [Candidatus Nomurabacteria bacterium]
MESNKLVALVVIIGGLLIGGVVLFSSGNEDPTKNVASVENVVEEAGKQVVTVSAKGGYSPRVSKAKADTPTILKMETKATFDCSSALSIPALGYQGNLPPTGVTEIEVPPQIAGTKLRGSCGMGMYSFEIDFI